MCLIFFNCGPPRVTENRAAAFYLDKYFSSKFIHYQEGLINWEYKHTGGFRKKIMQLSNCLKKG